MDRHIIDLLSQRSDDEITKRKVGLISEYICSDQVRWNNKKALLAQQKKIDEMIKTAPSTDCSLSLLLSEVSVNLTLLRQSLEQLQQLQNQAIVGENSDETSRD